MNMGVFAANASYLTVVRQQFKNLHKKKIELKKNLPLKKSVKMANTISIEYPNFLANSMRMNESDFENEIKVSGLVKLFELGKISTGIASKALGISRIAFLEILGKYKVNFLNFEDLDSDLENA